jgi:hypothetical protein
MYHGCKSELSVGQRAFLYQDRLCYDMLQKSRALSSFCWQDVSQLSPRRLQTTQHTVGNVGGEGLHDGVLRRPDHHWTILQAVYGAIIGDYISKSRE